MGKLDFSQKEPPRKKPRLAEDGEALSVSLDQPIEPVAPLPQRWPFERALENTRYATLERGRERGEGTFQALT